MSFDVNRLYELLPAFYRIKDARLGTQMLQPGDRLLIATLEQELKDILNQESFEAKRYRKLLDEKQRGPLKALLGIIAEQIAILEENFDQLYDDQFIETCAEWVVPYIGDLVGTRGVYVFPDATFSQRSQVANTLSYRKRKGTAAVLEQLVEDVTGWNASVVEYFELLATTQYLNHLREENIAITKMRSGDLNRRINKPFDKATHTLDVRSIEKKRGIYNIPNVGIWLWRIKSYPHTKVPAYQVDAQRYKFDPLGFDQPIYNQVQTEESITHLASEINVPMPISPSLMIDMETYYGESKSLLIYKDNSGLVPVEGLEIKDMIKICNLSDIIGQDGVPIGWSNMPVDKTAIDPVLGRIAFPAASIPTKVEVNYHSGFSSALGGGEYSRSDTFKSDTEFLIKVPSETGTIQEALDSLMLTGGIIEIESNGYYFETPVAKIANGKKIELRAADKFRPIIVLNGDLLIEGEDNSEFFINGILFYGGTLIVPLKTIVGSDNQLYSLTLTHCTLLPGPSLPIGSTPAKTLHPGLRVELPATTINFSFSITGSISAVDGSKVVLEDSILDASDETEIAYSGLQISEPGASLTIRNTTVIGKVYSLILNASNTIFNAALKPIDFWTSPIMAERLQEGCIRFSYVPFGSRLPRLYHCQPSIVEHILKVRPVFNSKTYGDATYCQLSQHCALEIRQGADDEAEMGVFHHLYQPQREQNLRTRLNEYLRFSLEAGILYAS